MMAALPFCAGLLLGALILLPLLLRQRRQARALQAAQTLADDQARMQVRAETEVVDTRMQAELELSQQRSLDLQAGWTRMRSEFEELQSLLDQLGNSRGNALRQAGTLSSSLEELQGVEMTFDRWHADMKQLLDHNRQMHSKNDDFAQIVRQMVIVGLNASIEAAHAGPLGRGFGVVATEMRELSARAEALSADYRSALYQNDLITTATFQDMQASGRMIIGAVRGLELTNRKSMELLAAPAETA
ncbi:chemotaxis protein [Xylophilus rhododendri]|uniref:Chemotaxis protein n=1 Tax=Xylophilus rhododendri TaxID=2697032 RepID=A0A857J0Q4_9BURK|nr:methyl-accepting chemotaxis protein [Xylophilus rhododendri]QHI97444.1 chemotaxis protein [Xylophilus rhododendri]